MEPSRRALASRSVALRVAQVSVATDDLNNLKVAELKQHLKDRDLAVNGKKPELIARLEAAISAEAEDEAEAEFCELDDDLESCTVSALKGHLRARGLPVSGKKTELVERLRDATPEESPCEEEDLEGCSVPQLKDRLKERGLPVSGRKAELIDRLKTGTTKDEGVTAPKSSKTPSKRPAAAKDDLRSLLLR